MFKSIGGKNFRFLNLAGNILVFFFVLITFLLAASILTVVVTVRVRNLVLRPSWLRPEDKDVLKAESVRYFYTEEITAIGRTNDTNQHIYDITMIFGFTKKNKAIEQEINRRKLEFQDLLRGFFGLRSSSDFRAGNEWKLKTQLLKKINGFLQRGKVDEVLFLIYDVI